MTMQALPTRAQIDRAQPLEFKDPPTEKQTSIRIEVGPAGITVTAEYTGTLSSIPAAIERLRSAGVLQLVEQSRPAPPTVAPANIQPPRARKRSGTAAEPWFDSRGEACCPIHRKVLLEGQYGHYCPARAGADEGGNAKGYCTYSIDL